MLDMELTHLVESACRDSRWCYKSSPRKQQSLVRNYLIITCMYSLALREALQACPQTKGKGLVYIECFFGGGMQDAACLVIGMTTYCFGHGNASVALTHNNRWLLHVTIHVHVAASCVYITMQMTVQDCLAQTSVGKGTVSVVHVHRHVPEIRDAQSIDMTVE